jgi:DNA-binding protein H-NS
MAKEYKSVFNCETQTEELVELTKAEITQKQKDLEIATARIAEYEAKLVAKNNLLTRLGITEEEAALLLA